jgi:hypothetical protein
VWRREDILDTGAIRKCTYFKDTSRLRENSIYRLALRRDVLFDVPHERLGWIHLSARDKLHAPLYRLIVFLANVSFLGC